MTTGPLRLVIFDVDGTLIDSQAHILSSMTAAFAAVDRPVPPRARALSVVGLSLPVALAALAEDAPRTELDRMVAAYKDTFATMRSADHARLSPLYPGARAAIDAIAARDTWLMGVATGKSARGLDAVLSTHALTPMFVTRQNADGHPSKPHPSMVEAALSETGVDAADAVVVGDTSFDMDMARAAGVAAIGVSWGYHPAARLRDAGAATVLNSFDGLVPALTGMWG